MMVTMEHPATVTEPEALFSDAETLFRAALERLERNDIRDAAEKAWGAMVQAANGMLVARTGRERPATAAITRSLVDDAAERGHRLENLAGRFNIGMNALHGQCFYNGICDPRATTERRIRQTSDFIEEARRMAKR